MNFIVLLLLWWAKHSMAVRHWVQHDNWWRVFARRMTPGVSPWLSLAWLVLPPMVVVGWVLWGLSLVLHGWLVLPFSLLIMVYCLGRENTRGQLHHFREAWLRGDEEAAYLAAEHDLGVGGSSESELFFNVQRHLLWCRYQGFFAVIFWFVLLGPVIPLGYRLLDLAENAADSVLVRERAHLFRHALDWVPVRILAMSFTLIGNMDALSKSLRHHFWHWEISAADLLVQVALDASEPVSAVAREQGMARLENLWVLLMRGEQALLLVFALCILLF